MSEKTGRQRKDLEFLEAGLSSAEEVSGKDHPSILSPLNAVAEFHLTRRNFERAEELLIRAATITAKESPASQERLMLARQKLGWLKYLQGNHDDAETFFRQAYEVASSDQHPGTREEAVAQALRTLVAFYVKAQRLSQAEDALKNLLSLYQRSGQEDNYRSAFVIVSLAVLTDAMEHLTESADFVEKAALIIKDKCAIGYTVDYLSLSEIMNLYFVQGRKAEALELVGCTMLESEDSFWPHNPVAGDVLARLAEFMRAQRKYKQAESLYKRSISIKELTSVPGDPELASLLLNLSNLYLGLRKYADAEPLIKTAMKSRVQHFGVYHPAVAACVETYATILRKTKRVSLANRLDARAREIRYACVARLDKQLAEAASKA